MSKQFLSVFTVFVLFALAGCELFKSPAEYAVLDLDAIANATGQAAIIKQKIEKANKDLNQQLNDIANSLNEQLANEKKKMKSKPSKSDKLDLEQLTLQANQKMNQAKALASQKSQQFQAALVRDLRQVVAPIAENIARERGANLVLTTNNAMLWFNSEVDITDEVIGEMRAKALLHPVNQDTGSDEKSATSSE